MTVSTRSDDGTAPLVLITTVGTNTGNEHITPVCVVQDGVDLVVAGSAGGRSVHPQWYKNLAAKGEVTVEYLGDTYRARATAVPNSLERVT